MTDAASASATETKQAPASSFVTRVALVMGGWTTLHMLVIASLAHGVVPGGWWTFLALYALVLACMAGVLRTFSEDHYPGKWTRLLVMRPFWYAQVALFPMSAAGALGWIVGLPFGNAVARGRLALAVMGILVALLCVAGYIGSRSLVTRRLTFEFPDLPAAFEGVTIAQLSDLHVGPHTPRGHLRAIVRAVEKAQPDIIAFTGDQVDDYDQDVAHFASWFGHLRARHGVYAIAGNHDVYAGWPGVREGMERAGMRVLVNGWHRVEHEGDHLYVIGTGDPAGLRSFGEPQPDVAPDIDLALANVPENAFTLALAHNPALWPMLAKGGVHLTLSGHTHHGQLSIPFLNWSLASPFLELAMGTHARGRSRLYINPGTNVWALPLRVGAWPEVTIVTLRKAPSASPPSTDGARSP